MCYAFGVTYRTSRAQHRRGAEHRHSADSEAKGATPGAVGTTDAASP